MSFVPSRCTLCGHKAQCSESSFDSDGKAVCTWCSVRSVERLPEPVKETPNAKDFLPEDFRYEPLPAIMPDPMPKTLDDVLQQRGSRYGNFLCQFVTAQAIKEGMRESGAYDSLPAIVKETLDMIATKISRIIEGDPFYDDSWTDIAGFATLMANHCNTIKKAGVIK